MLCICKALNLARRLFPLGQLVTGRRHQSELQGAEFHGLVTLTKEKEKGKEKEKEKDLLTGF